ncbi:MAG: adenylyltransferase/cytidyltransferase family protein [Candidatus Sungbacteria bacterium]|nr:adenylyltransferase/cytidyltransferase family protein [Candidatus Sungbacteria bacterium]
MKNKKLKSWRNIQKTAGDLRKRRKKIVAASGCFDILHAGHIDFLGKARAAGDVLVVLLNSDSSVKSYKGESRPLNSLHLRAHVLSGLEAVDFIVPFDEQTPLNILGVIKPHVFAQGSDWGKNCIERETVERNGGKIKVIKKIEGFSTTGLLEKIRALPII